MTKRSSLICATRTWGRFSSILSVFDLSRNDPKASPATIPVWMTSWHPFRIVCSFLVTWTPRVQLPGDQLGHPMMPKDMPQVFGAELPRRESAALLNRTGTPI